MRKLRVFVSSVQKELEDERLIVQNLMNTDRRIDRQSTDEIPESTDPARETNRQVTPKKS